MITKLGSVITEYAVRNKHDEDIPVYSVTNEQGFCTGYFSKDVASKDRTTYKIVPRGYFAYNPSRINVGSVDWQDCQDRVIVSPLYVVFGVDEKLDQQYLLHYLKSDITLTYIKTLATGSVRDNLKFSVLQEFPINLRPIEEQRKIASVLNRIDRVIALRKEELETLDNLVKSRFIELFGKYADTTRLSEVAAVTGGLTKNSKRDQLPLQMPYLRVANVGFASIDVTEMLDIGLTKEECEKTLLQYEDLLFVEGNGSPDQIGRVAIWRNEIRPCVHQNHLIKSRFDQSVVNPVFAMHYFMSQRGREQIKGKAVSTSGLYTLSVSKVAELLMPVPPMALQKSFAAFVEQTDKSKLCGEMEVAA